MLEKLYLTLEGQLLPLQMKYRENQGKKENFAIHLLFGCCLSGYQLVNFMGRYMLTGFSSTLLQQCLLPGFSDLFIEILLFWNKHFRNQFT